MNIRIKKEIKTVFFWTLRGGRMCAGQPITLQKTEFRGNVKDKNSIPIFNTDNPK